MKAIETSYKGYRFRSRVEARWAIFFDALDLPWEYEPEGYDLDGVYYLPDFWIPDWDMFAEIKGSSFDKLTEDEQIKIRKLAFHSRKPVILLDGAPDTKEYRLFEYDPWSNTLFERMEPLFIAMDDDMELTINYEAAVKAARSARFEHGEQYASHTAVGV